MTERTEWNMKDETTALCIPYTIGLPDGSILCKCHSRFFEARCDLQISFENIFSNHLVKGGPSRSSILAVRESCLMHALCNRRRRSPQPLTSLDKGKCSPLAQIGHLFSIFRSSLQRLHPRVRDPWLRVTGDDIFCA